MCNEKVCVFCWFIVVRWCRELVPVSSDKVYDFTQFRQTDSQLTWIPKRPFI